MIQVAEIAADTEVMLIFTGAGLKYDPPALPAPTHLAGAPDDAAAPVARLLTGN